MIFGKIAVRSQFVERTEAVAHRLPLPDQLRQNIGIGRGGRVKQDHRAVVRPVKDFLHGFVRRHLVIVVPVGVGVAPENRLVAERIRPLKICFRELAFRRTIIFCDVRAHCILIDFFHCRQFVGEFRLGFCCHVGMLRGVIADEMSLIVHALHQIRVSRDEIFKDKERGGNLLRLQRIEDAGDIAVFVAGVKSQVENFVVLSEEIAAVLVNERHLSRHRRTFPAFHVLAVPV